MLYKYCNTNGFDILVNSRLRLSRIDSFNDPFELLFGIDENSASINIEKEYKENPNILKEWMQILTDQNITYNITSLSDILEKFIKFQIDDFKRAIKKVWENWNQKMGIICMSESMDVIQMWAHYTDNHRGIVVGLEEREFVNDKEAIIEVCYRDKMVLFPITGNRDNLEQYVNKLIPEVISRKETNWSYEKEIRLYGTLNEPEQDGHYYMKVPTSSIKELYLGLRSDDKTEVHAVCLKKREEYKHLKVYKMTKDESSYKLIPNEI